MPGMSGKEPAGEFLISDPETKILFMPGYANDTISHYDIANLEPLLCKNLLTQASLAT